MSGRTGSTLWRANIGRRGGSGALRPDVLREIPTLIGPDAEAILSEIAANDVHKPMARLFIRQMLNDAGGIEADLTIVRHSRDRFSLVTGTGFATRDFHWIRSSIPAGANASLVDTTSQTAVLALMGPKSREICNP